MLKELLAWLGFFVPLVGGVYFGFVEGVPGAQNIALFAVWAVWLPLCVLALTDTAVKGAAARPPPPAWYRRVNWALVLACVGVLAWAGAFVSAFALLAACACATAGRQAADKLRAAAQPDG